MPRSKQEHFFATRADLEPGLAGLESAIGVKYALCDLYHGPIFELHLSLLDWKGLGMSASGDDITGAQWLVVRRDYEIRLRPVPEVSGEIAKDSDVGKRKAIIVGEDGTISKTPVALHQFLSDLERSSIERGATDQESRHNVIREIRYELGPSLNPESVVFQPGGIYNNEMVLVCGHIGTATKAPGSINLYNTFVKYVTAGFEKIREYRVGPEALRLMEEGYRMVTISVGSSPEYDLKR